MCARTGLWSLVKRAPKSSVKRKVFEVPGPGVDGAVPLDARARAVFAYFKKYNYEVWHSEAAGHMFLLIAGCT
jgi:Cofactor assembly of complex C subunit B